MPFIISPHRRAVVEDGIIRDGLLHRWTMDEGSGTSAVDDGSVGQNGVISNPNWISGGAPGYANCLEFSSATTYVDCGNLFGGAGLTEFTILLWYYFDVLASTDYLFGQDGSGGNQGDGSIRTTGSGIVQFYDQGNNKTVTSNMSPSVSTWYHTAVRYDKAKYDLFTDGVFDNTEPGANLTVWNNAFNAEISRSDSFHFLGRANDMRVYNRAMLDSEILQVAQSNG